MAIAEHFFVMIWGTNCRGLSFSDQDILKALEGRETNYIAHDTTEDDSKHLVMSCCSYLAGVTVKPDMFFRVSFTFCILLRLNIGP